MPIVDSVKNRIISSLNENEIRQKAEEIRFYSNLSAGITSYKNFQRHNALIDIAALLYFNYIYHDPMNPFWGKRDRVFWSDSDLSPLIYSTLGLCGYFPIEDLVKHWKDINSFDIFLDRFKVPGIEISVDCPGIGLGVAVGDALSAAMAGSSYKVFCIMSSAEQSLGTVWEAADSAYKYGLGNLVAVIENSCSAGDSGEAEDLLSEQLADKYASFGWQVYTADSRDHEKVVEIFNNGRKENLPTAVILSSYSYSDENFSARLSSEILEKNILPDESKRSAEEENGNKQESSKHAASDRFSDKYGWNISDDMKAEFRSMEESVINFILESKAVKSDNYIFYSKKSSVRNLERQYPGIGKIIKSEENMILTASGLAKEGRIPFIISGGPYFSEKNYDQLRNTVCLNNFNVKFIDFYSSYAEASSDSRFFVSDDISAVQSIRNLNVFIPSDAHEAEKIISCAADIYGPVLIRIPLGLFPLISDRNTPWEKDTANVIRYRKKEKIFCSAFNIFRGSEYSDEGEDLALVAAGSVVSEAMRASYILKEEFAVEVRIINAASLKPFDEETVLNAVFETGAVLAVCENDNDSFSDIIASYVLKNKGCSFDFIFASSCDRNCRDALLNNDNTFGSCVTAEFIAEKALELLNRKDIKK